MKYEACSACWPDAAATAPNLVLTAPACYEADPERIRAEGCVLSIREIV